MIHPGLGDEELLQLLPQIPHWYVFKDRRLIEVTHTAINAIGKIGYLEYLLT